MSILSPDNWAGLSGVIGAYTDEFTSGDLKEYRLPGLAGLWRADDRTNTGGIVTLLTRVPRQSSFRANSSGFSPVVANEAAANSQPFAAFDGTKQLQSSASKTALTSGPMQLSATAFTLYFVIIATSLASARTLYSATGAFRLDLNTNGSLQAIIIGGTARASSIGKVVVGTPVIVRVSWNASDGLIKFAFNGVADGAGQSAGATPGAVTANNIGGAGGANLMSAKVGTVMHFNGVDHGAVSGTPFADHPALIQAALSAKYGI
jgi:hypothetical protein